MKPVLHYYNQYFELISLASLLLIIPLLIFPYGAFPYLALGLALLLLIWHWAGSCGPKIRLEDIPLLILLGMALLGYAISIDQSLSLPRLWGIFLGLIVFFILRNAISAKFQSEWMALALVLLGLGMAGIGLLGTDWGQVRLFDLPGLYQHLPTLIRGLPHSNVFRNDDLIGPRMIGITMGIIAPVFLPMLAWQKRPWLRALAAVTFLVTTGTLLLTQSLSGALALLAGTFIVLLFVSRWFWLLIPLGMAALVTLVVRIGPQALGTMLLSVEDVAGIAVVLRLDIWSRALDMLRDMPFTGIGLNSFDLVMQQYYPGYLLGFTPDAHNLLMQTAADLGLPGLVAFLWFLIAWFIQALKRIKQEDSVNKRLLLMGVTAGMVAYLGHGVMDALMLGSKPTFMVWVLLGIGAALTSPQLRRPKTKVYQWLLACLALPLLVGLLMLSQPASSFMNLGALQAHKLLSPFPITQNNPDAAFDMVRTNLSKAIALDPSLRQAHLLLARIDSVQGNFSTAQSHYQTRVALDMQDPLAIYNPAKRLGILLNLRQPSHPAIELQKIYQAWNVRYPDRAEGYLLNSILASQYQADPEGAKSLLHAGLKAAAQPPGLLEFVLWQH